MSAQNRWWPGRTRAGEERPFHKEWGKWHPNISLKVQDRQNSEEKRVLASVICIWHHLESFWKRGSPNWKKNTSTRLTHGQARGTFICSVMDVRGPCSLWFVPPLDWWSWVLKKAGWASHEEQANKLQPAMASASALTFRSLPCVSSCTDFLLW